MRKTSRNAENFSASPAIINHMESFSIPIAESRRRPPPEMEEVPGWGKWPKRWVRETWERRQKEFYELKKKTPPKKPESWAQMFPFYWKHLYY